MTEFQILVPNHRDGPRQVMADGCVAEYLHTLQMLGYGYHVQTWAVPGWVPLDRIEIEY